MKTPYFTVLAFIFSVTSALGQQATYDVTPGHGNGLRFWSSNNYKIHMGNASEYIYGPVTNYSIKMNMNSDSGRGWTWGQPGIIPIAALSNTGTMQIAGTFTANKMLLNDPNTLTDWNLLWQSGFFEGYKKLNAPDQSQWYWGVNLGHTNNHSGNRYGGQILIKNASLSPTMYFRSRNSVGDGIWAKVLHNYGNQHIDGNLGIGNSNPTEKLVVDGKILAEEVKVQNVPASDYVFEPDYDLKPIKEVEAFVKENKHLPDIPSAEEFKENGVGLGEMDNMLLRKVEELMLYVIELKKENDELKASNDEFKVENEIIKSELIKEIETIKSKLK